MLQFKVKMSDNKINLKSFKIWFLLILTIFLFLLIPLIFAQESIPGVPEQLTSYIGQDPNQAVKNMGNDAYAWMKNAWTEQLGKSEFIIYFDSLFNNFSGVFYFLLKRRELDAEEIVKGPPLRLKDFVVAFQKKHKICFEKNSVLYAREKVEHTQLDDVVKKVLNEKYVTERVEKVLSVKVV